MPVPHHSIFYRLDALSDVQPTVSKQELQTETNDTQDRTALLKTIRNFSKLHECHCLQYEFTLCCLRRLVGWLEFNIPFQHKCGYIRDDCCLRKQGYSYVTLNLVPTVTRTVHHSRNLNSGLVLLLKVK